MQKVLAAAKIYGETMKKNMLFIFVFCVSCVSCVSVSSSQSNDVKCVLPDLSKDDALNIVISKNKSIKRNDISSIEVAISMMDSCKYLVRIWYSPPQPGNFQIYEIDKNRKIIKVVPGH